MFDVGLIQWLQTFSSVALDTFFKLFTNLGSHYAYMLIIPFIYWAVDRRIGRRLAGVFLASMWLNGLVKEYLTLPRPDPALVRVMADEPSPGFPSGHAQGAITLWGYMALAFRRRWLTWFAALLIILLPVSRLYLGVHFPADIVGGLAIGGLLVLLYYWYTERPRKKEMSIPWRMFWSVIIPVLLYPLYQTGTAEQIIGFFIGFFTADLLAVQAVPYEARVSLGKQLLKLLIGYTGFALLVALHMLFLPVGWPGVFGYSLIAVWIAFGAPALFRAFGLDGQPKMPPAPRPAQRSVGRYMVATAIVVLFVIGSTIYINKSVPVLTRPQFLPTDRALVIAHAGAKGLAPENTMAAFENAVQVGIDVLEMDVHLTADGHVVVIHDATVNRTTNGQGAVASMTLAEIQALDAGYRFTTDRGQTYRWRGQGIVIPTLEEVLSSFDNIPFVVEMKADSDELAQAVLDVIQATGTADRIVLASFHDGPLHYVRRQAPHIPTSMSQNEVTRLVIRQRLGVGAYFKPEAEFIQIPEWHGPIRVASPGLARLARRQGVEVHAWTINDEEAMMRLIGLGANGLITDYPERMHNVLRYLEGRALDEVFY